MNDEHARQSTAGPDHSRTGRGEMARISERAREVFPGMTLRVSLIDEAMALVAESPCRNEALIDLASGVFSGQTIRDNTLLEVCDARGDGRYKDSPLVTGHPNVVYYAGVPLRLKDGSIPGAISVTSSTPCAPMQPEQTAVLERMAADCSEAFELCLAS